MTLVGLSFSFAQLQFVFSPRLDATAASSVQETEDVSEVDEVEETGDVGDAGDAELPPEEPLTLEDRIVAAGFRSPSTINMLQRLQRRLTEGLEGEKLAEVEAVLAELVDAAGELAAADQRPFGRSIEHQLKQLFNAVSRRHPVVPEIESVTPPAEEPVPEAPPVEEAPIADEEPAPAVDVSV
ncbi:MAG: hypothetical protein IH789_01125 [Acidobacteria bacterium]|nr:hypothetical protein [Acidobacteriota bacterium]